MSKASKLTLVYVVLAAAGLLWARSLLEKSAESIPYTTFKQQLQNGNISEVQVGQHTIDGQYKSPPGKPFRTVRIEDPSLLADLEKHGVTSTGTATGGSALGWILGWIAPVALMALVWLYIVRRMGQQAQAGVMSFGKSRFKVVGDRAVGVTFADVAGVDEAKAELEEIVQFLRSPERYARIGARIPKGVLLVGPPGTGKTLLARAVAGEAHVSFFALSGSDFVEMFVGLGAARVRDLFQQAQEKAPCIIFVDELDALGKARGLGPTGGNDEREQTLNQLLAEMDGFDPNRGVVLMAATNRPEILDPALLRPGRFDRQVLVDRPDRTGREQILRIHAAHVKLEPGVDLRAIAQRTPGFVGADLANLINEAALLAVRRGKEQVGMDELNEAIDRVVAGLEKKGRLISPRERRIVAYHEVGHAVVGEVLPLAEKTQKISVVPRGLAALGMTWHRPTEDRYLLTKGELEERIAALMGGRAAEEIFIGDISTGAQDDLARASDLTRAMVRQYGMSAEVGPVSFDPQRKPLLPVSDVLPKCEHGGKVADEIDAQVRSLLDAALMRARQVLDAHRSQVEVIAQRLLEAERIEGDDLRRLLGQVTPAGRDTRELPRAAEPA
jgi:cell division protease FtsH